MKRGSMPNLRNHTAGRDRPPARSIRTARCCRIGSPAAIQPPRQPFAGVHTHMRRRRDARRDQLAARRVEYREGVAARAVGRAEPALEVHRLFAVRLGRPGDDLALSVRLLKPLRVGDQPLALEDAPLVMRTN